MYGSNEITQLRQTSIVELQEKRRRFLRGIRLLKWAMPVIAIAGFLSILFPKEMADTGFLFAIVALLYASGVFAKTKIWFIDLVLSEKTLVSEQ